MSFCRITGKARGLPKPNYFPLLPPISPADAKRFCRITNKSQGLPGHHFIPALLGAKGARAHCRVTAKSEGQAPHHFPTLDGSVKPHDIIPGYRYVFPKFDEDHKLQQRVLQLMLTKTPQGESSSRFVYAVDERQIGLVIPAGLEAAVRDGDIRDLMLDKEKDTMLVKLHQGPSVAIDVTNLIMEEGHVLWDGFGPSPAVLKQREKEEKEREIRRKKRQEGLSSRKQIFENKEKAAEEEEIEMEKIRDARKSRIVKVKLRGGEGDLEVMMDHGPAPLEDYFNDLNNEPVFGHIVQTATAVEFFPGDSILNLPEGKVVPGRLVRNSEGVKFVPGIMSDDRFIPGQIVMTNSGEQFVPGQVVDTRDGPKFVPGQIAETISGPKFVPGQTIETEDGPQFVPGQIIETKAGPTFIPGQIIYTDDEPRFVPGRVVETAEGPRFVPGRVIESGNQVTFVSGQVVETSEGLKFVAPDLEYMPEGGHEFSVQGFEVSPEELKFLRPATGCNPASCGVVTIDSKMLRQLSEAGVSVGRYVATKLPEVDIRALPVVVEKLKLDGAQALKMSHVMAVLSQVALKISQRHDLCASDVPLDEDTGDKLLIAVKKNKDLGKYLQAIVASSVVAARNNFDEESLVSAVSSAMEYALAAQFDSNLTKESLLMTIEKVISNQLPHEEKIIKERLLDDIKTALELELKTKSERKVTKESLLKILNTVLDQELGGESATKAVLQEAVKSAIEKEQIAQFGETMDREMFLAIVQAAVDPGILEKASELLSKEALMMAIDEEIQLKETSSEWRFEEEMILPIIKTAVEKEVSAKGVTLTNGSLPAAIMASIKKELSSKSETVLSEEKLMACLTSVLESGLPEEVQSKISTAGLLSAVSTAIISEKSQKVLTEEILLSTAYAALEKTLTGAKWENLSNGKEVLKKSVAKIQEEVTIKHENAEIKKTLLGNLEKSVERKISEACQNVLNEEMAVSALTTALCEELGGKGGTAIPKEKLSRVIAEVFEKEKFVSNSPMISKEKLLAALHCVIESKDFLHAVPSNVSLLAALDVSIQEKKRAKYDVSLTEEAVMTAVGSAIDIALSEVKEMKVSRASIIAAVSKELKKMENASEGRIIAAAQSAIEEELLAKCEKVLVKESVLKAFENEIEILQSQKCQSLLSETELLSALDSAIELELAKIPKCSINKETLMASVSAAIEEKKLQKRENILTEKVMLECMQSAILSNAGEDLELSHALLACVNEAVRKEKKSRSKEVLTEKTLLQAVALAMETDLIQNNKISVTKEFLEQIVNEAVAEEKLAKGDRKLTEEELVHIVQASVEKKMEEGEAHLLLKAFGSVVEQERKTKSMLPLKEQEFIRVVALAIDEELQKNEYTTLSKDQLLSAVTSSINEEVIKHGSLMSEGCILATAYAAIEKKCSENGESADVKQSLLSGVDSAVEMRRDENRVLNEEIILEAIASIADRFTQNAENKTAIITAVASAIEREKLKKGGDLIGECLANIVNVAVEEHISEHPELLFNEKSFLSAMTTAIGKEQTEKRNELLTKDILSAAVASAVEDQVSQNPGLTDMKEKLLQTAYTAVENECACVTDKKLTEKTLLAYISSNIETVLGDLVETGNLDKVVDSMQRYLSENLDEVIVGTVNHMVANESAMDKLKYATSHAGNTMQVIEKLSSVLNDNMGEAFQKLSTNDPGLLKEVMERLDLEKMASKDQATEALQKAIVGAVRQRSVETLRGMMQDAADPSSGKDFKELLMQSVGLARALGMNQVATALLNVASDPMSHEVLANDETVIDILQRLTIMRQFAETKPEISNALTQLISDPELAKRDPVIRELVRHSTALMTVPEEMLHSSADIPASLLLSDNTLAMEQFLAKSRRPPRALLIIKSGLQAVVPKEAARGVLTGQVPYAVLDEKGIRYFEPLHVFSTMKLKYYAAHCFSMYKCSEAECESESATPTLSTPRGSFSSLEDFYRRGSVPHRRLEKQYPMCKRVAELCKRPFTQNGLYGVGLDSRKSSLYLPQGCL